MSERKALATGQVWAGAVPFARVEDDFGEGRVLVAWRIGAAVDQRGNEVEAEYSGRMELHIHAAAVADGIGPVCMVSRTFIDPDGKVLSRGRRRLRHAAGVNRYITARRLELAAEAMPKPAPAPPAPGPLLLLMEGAPSAQGGITA